MIRPHSLKTFLTRTRTGSALLGLLMLALAGLGIYAAKPFASLLVSIGYGCPLNRLTGLYCPACGVTRAVYALARGEWLTALSLNPLFFLTAGIYFALAAYLLFNSLRPAPRPLSFHLKVWQLWTILAVVLGYGVLRNLFGV